MEGFLVPMYVPIIKVGILVEPHGEAKGRPTPLLVENNLAGFEFGLVRLPQPATSPDCRPSFSFEKGKIRPENRPSLTILGSLEQELRVHHRYIIRVQQQHFAKPRMHNCIGLKFPALQSPRRKAFSHFQGINALNAQRSQQRPHLAIHFAPPKMPYLHGQTTPQVPQQIDADPGVGEVLYSTAANDDSTSSEVAGISRNAPDELITRDSRTGDMQRLLVVRIR